VREGACVRCWVVTYWSRQCCCCHVGGLLQLCLSDVPAANRQQNEAQSDRAHAHPQRDDRSLPGIGSKVIRGCKVTGGPNITRNRKVTGGRPVTRGSSVTRGGKVTHGRSMMRGGKVTRASDHPYATPPASARAMSADDTSRMPPAWFATPACWLGRCGSGCEHGGLAAELLLHAGRETEQRICRWLLAGIDNVLNLLCNAGHHRDLSLRVRLLLLRRLGLRLHVRLLL